MKLLHSAVDGMETRAWLKALGLSLVLTSVTLTAWANPQGGQVVAGKGSISAPNGNTTVITQKSNKLIIDWSSFNIANGQRVQFKQPSISASALNRIFDQDPTQIFGSLTSNGQVLLLNPNGIIFGRTASVNTGSFFATSLGISNGDFMAGKLDFSAPAGEDGGAIVNHGLLQAADGGSISLMGGTVYNDGTIQATLGQVDMVAGHAVTIDFSGDGLMQFEVTQPVLHKMYDADSGAAVTNAGTVEADGGQVIMTADIAQRVFAAAVNNSGVVEATGVQEKAGGVFLAGIVDPSDDEQRSGDASLPALSGVSGAAGSIQLTATGGNVVDTGTLDVSNTHGDAGNILMRSNSTTEVLGDGVLDAKSNFGMGGDVQVLGYHVGFFDEASVNASGALGGGTILAGGAEHGASGVQAAEATVLDTDASLTANGLGTGNGGTVILWANDYNGFYGTINVNGGAQGGSGGFTETSAHTDLEALGRVNMRGGQSGTWLLDPDNITINGVADITGASCLAGAATCFTAAAATSTLSETNLVAALTAGTTVIVYTGTTGTQNGDITVSNAITTTAANPTLDLEATGNININAAISGTTPNKLNVNLWADYSNAGPGLTYSPNATCGGAGTGCSIAFGTFSITTFGGAVDLETSLGSVTGTGSIITTGPNAATGIAGGNVTVEAGGAAGIKLTAITTTGGTATTTADAGGAAGSIYLGTDATAVTNNTAPPYNAASIAVTTITANGGAGRTTGTGGNAGSVYEVSVGNVSGTGGISTLGGNGGASAGATGGNGGLISITVDPTAADTLPNLTTTGGKGGTAASVNAGKSGNVSITLNGTGATIPTFGTLTISGANGGTTTGNGGNGGGVTITDNATGGTLTVPAITSTGGTSIGAANTSGAGGALTLNAVGVGGTLSLTAANLPTLTGGTTSLGTGGAGGAITINENGGTLTLPTSPNVLSSVGGAATGNSGTGGAGGNITINDVTGALTLTNVILTSTGGAATTTAGATGGAGGTVTVTDSTGSLTLSGLTINDNGGAGTIAGTLGGAGGVVNITGNGTTLATTPTINANGGASTNNIAGAGGTVTLTSVGTMTITNAITTDGGNSTGTNGAGGSINVYSDETTVNIDASLNDLAGTGAGAAGTAGLVSLGISTGGLTDEVGNINETGGIINANKLTVYSTGFADLNAINSITTLSTSNGDNGFTFDNGTTPFTVNGVITTNNNGGAPVTLIGDSIILNSQILAGTGLVTITSSTPTANICVGSVAGCALNLSIAGLDNIKTSGGVTIGSATNTGGIIVNGAVPFSDVTGGTITLETSGAGAITTGAATDTLNLADANVSLTFDTTGTGSVQLPGASVSGSGVLSVISGANITQFAATALSVMATSDFTGNGAGSNITLANTGNAFSGAVTFTDTASTGNVAVDDAGAIILGASSLGSGTFQVVSNADNAGNDGGITQTGAIVQASAAGAATFTVNGTAGGITLTNTGNDFTGAVSFNDASSNGSVAVDDANTITLGASNLGSGTFQVLSNADNTGNDGGITEAGAIVQAAGALAATFTVNGTAGGITLTSAGNDFIGAVLLNDASSNGNVSVNNDTNTLILGTSTVGSGTLSLTGVGISQTGAITQSGAGAVTLAGGAGAISLTNAGNDFVGVVGVSNSGTNDVAITDMNSLTLGTISIGGNLTLISTGALNVGTGTVAGDLLATSNGGAISETAGGIVVDGTSGFTAGAASITLNDAANNFMGAVSLSNSGANNVSVNNDTNTLILGTSTVGSGTLSLTGVGISQTGAITQSGAGAVTLAGGAGAISLTNAGNDFVGVVGVSNSGTNDVAITDMNSLTLGTISIGGNLTLISTGALNVGTGTVAGDLLATSNGGAISETAGGIVVDGTSGFTAGAASITLNDAANNFMGAVSLSNSGANNVSVNNDTNTLILGTSTVGSGTLSLTGVGISQTGAITQSGAGAVTLAGGAGAISLTNAGNDFVGVVGVSNSGTNDVAITDMNSLTLGTISIGGNLTLISTGALNVGTGTVAGDLLATSNGGAISETAGGIVVDGTSGFTAGAASITLNDAANNFMGAVSLSNSGANNVSVNNDTNTLILGTSTVGSGTLSLTGVGISQTGAITQSGAGAVTLAGGAGAISLTNAGNDFVGVVGVSNSGTNDVAITDMNSLTLGTISIGGNLTLISTGALNVGTGTVAGDLLATSNGGAISETAGGIVVDGTSGFTAGAASITLNDAANNFMGAVSLSNSGANNVSVNNDTNTLILGTSTVGSGTLSLTGVGISQTGAITQSGAGAVTLAGGAGAISLTNAGNDFVGVVGVSNSGTNDVAITDMNSLTLGTISIGGNLTLISTGALNVGTGTVAGDLLATSNGGAISETAGGIVVDGTSGFTAGVGSVTLSDTANDFQGAVTVVSASTVTLDDTNSLTLAGIAASGAIQVNFGQGGGVSTLTLGDTAISAASFAINGGSAANDTIVGNDSGDTFTLTSANGGEIAGPNLPATTTFAGVGNLTGGSGADSFVFDGGSLVGNIVGGGGANTLDYHLVSTVLTVNLQTDTATDVGGTFSGITNLIGSTAITNSLTGDNAGDTFDITGTDSGNVNGTFTFSGIQTLDGGTGDDTFVIVAGGSIGTINGGGFATNGNTIQGDDNGDYFDITNSDIGSVGTSSGTPSNIVGSFSNIENLTGGTGDDTFAFSTSLSTITGNIAGGGGAGIDTVDYTGSSVTSVTLGAGLPGAGHITGISNLIGSGDGFTLVSDGTGDTFTISLADGGSVMYDGNTLSLTFSDVGNLMTNTLLPGGDTFKFTTGSLTGSLTGAGTNETLDYSGYGGPITVDLGTGAATLIGTVSGTFSGITDLKGSASSNDTLVGDNVGDTFTITGANSGNVDGTFTFSSIENLTGGTGADSFVISGGTLSGSINGGGGAGLNTLTGDNVANTWTITGANTGTVTDIGGTFSNIQNLVGGAASDAFTFSDGASLSGTVDGGTGTNTLNFGAYLTAVDATLTGLGATVGFDGNTTGSPTDPITGTFSNITNIDGAAAGTLTGMGAAATWDLNLGTYTSGNVLTFSGFDTLKGGSVSDVFDVDASVAYNLDGGSGTESYVFGDTDVLTGSITGGAGSNTLDLSAYTSALTWTITGANTGTVGPVTGGFTGMQTLDGGAGGNTFNINHSTAMSLNGGAGNDDYVFANGVILTGSIDGKGGVNTLNFGAYLTAVDATLTGLGATVGFDGNTTGSPTDPITGTFSNITNIDGAAAGTLTGMGAAATWDLNLGTYTSGNVLTFSGFDTLKGGSVSDVFDVDASVAYNLDGGSGTESYVFGDTDVLTGSITGGAGSNTLDLSAYTSALTWTITGANTGTVGPVTGGFTGMQTLDGGAGGNTFNINHSTAMSLNGGAGNDDFVFANGVILTGSIDGKGGVNTLNFGAYLTAVDATLTGLGATVGFDGNTTGSPTDPITGTFSNITNIDGAAAGTLTGMGAAATWDLNLGTYTSGNVLTFSGFDTLKGGSVSDVFDVDASVAYNLDGGSGTESYVFGDTDVLTGSITGGTGTNTLNFGAYLTAVDATLTGLGATVGFDGNTTGSPTDPITGTFSNITNIDGAAAGTLTGMGAAATWDLNLGTYTSGNVLTFSGFDTLKGGSVSDVFDVDASVAYNLDGGSGTESYVFGDTDVLTGSITGGAGSNTLDLSAYTSALTWTITGANTGTVGPVTGGFTGMQTLDGGAGGNTFNINHSTAMSLNGGAGNDDYVFANGVILTGSIDGKGGVNTLNFGAYLTAVDATLTGLGATVGFDGNTTGSPTDPITGTFSNITNIDGAAAGTLTGMGAAATWNLGAGTYTSGTNTLTFSGFDTLKGGSVSDVFDVDASVAYNLDGGSGTESYVFGDTDVLTGSITGGAGSNTLDLSAYTSALTWTITGANTGTVGPVTGGFTGMQTLDGGAGGNTFNINHSTAMSLNGGAGNDDYVFANGVILTGSIDGKGGVNTLNFGAYLTAVDATLTGLGATVGFDGNTTGSPTDPITGTFSNITNIDGAAAGTLTGMGAAATWDLNLGTYTSGNVLTFSGFDTLKGGSVSDVFDVDASVAYNLDGGSGTESYVFGDTDVLTGSITGGTGTNTLNFGAYLTAVDATLTGLGATVGFDGNTTGSPTDPITGTFSNITNIDGAAAGTLTGMGAAATWDLNLGTYTSGNVLTFSGFDTLKGGSVSDVFDVDASVAYNLDGGSGTESYVFGDTDVLTGSITGGAGSNTLDLSAYTSALTWTITGANTGTVGPVTGGFTGMQTLDGGAGGNTFNINHSTAMSLNGGAGNDDYVFANGVILTGSIDGKGGVNTLNFGAYLTAVDATLTGLGATVGFDGNTTGSPTDPITGTFSNITNIDGAAAGTLTGMGAAATWDLNLGTYTSGNVLTFSGFDTLKGGSVSDVFDVDASVAYNLDGGSGTESYVFGDTDVLTGSITGGAGSNTLDLSAYTSALTWTITGANTGTVGPVTGGFTGMQTLDGGAGGNTFNINHSTAMSLNGGAGNDDYVFANGVILTGSIDGKGGVNTLNFGAYLTAVDATLTGLGATVGFDGNTTGSPTDPITGTFSNITNIDGAAAGTLTGMGAAATWDLNLGTYTSGNVLTFSGFDTLKGGSVSDVFDVDASVAYNLDGGSGTESYVFGDTDVLTGSITGGAGSNTLDLSAYTSALTWTITGANTGTVGPVTGGFTGMQTLDGGAGGNTFNINHSTAMSLNGGAGNDDFVFANGVILTGSIDGKGGVNTLNFGAYLTAVDATLTGLGATVGFDGNTTGSPTDPITGTFSNITNIDGAAAGTLTGMGAAATWDLNLGTYTSGNVLTFSGFDTLKGGSVSDVFDVDASVAYNLDGGSGTESYVFGDTDVLTGSITGGTGTNTLNFGAYLTAVDATLTGLGATVGFDGNTTGSPTDPITGTFSNITNIDGAAAGTLTGMGAAATWDLNLGTYTSGNVLTFSGFDTLKGGSVSDVFDVDASVAYNLDGGSGTESYVFGDTDVLTGSITGGAGSNTLDLSAYTSALTWTITGANTGTVGPVTGGFTGMQTLDGGAGGNTFNINHSTAMSLNGGAGNDDYVFANGVILTGSIDGKGGVNTLNFGAYLTAVDATLTGLGATVGFDGNTTGSPTDPITGTFSNITNIDGAAAGTLTGMGAAATWNLGAGTYTSGTNTLTFSGFDTLKGGSVSDVFDVDASVAYNLDGGSGTESYVFGDTDVLTGSITGGAGSNTLDLSAYTSALTWTITGANTGTVGPVTGGFTGMQTLDGGAGGNTFNINHSTAMSLNGGAGNDDYVFANGVILTGSIDGKGGVNTLNFGAYLTAVDATLTGLGATVGFDGNTTGSPTDPITGTFSNITNIDGAAAGTLTGMGAAATWDLNLGTYTSGNVLTFSGFDTLKGGSVSDVFDVDASVAYNLDGGSGTESYVFGDTDVLTGSITGGTGTNTLNFGAYLTAVDATLTGLGATVGFDGNTTGSPTDPITGTFSNITNIDGAAAGTLTGMGAAATWDLNLGTYTSGNVLTFSGFDTLKGGSVSDVFDVDASVAYNLDGGSGTESYVFGDTDVLTGSITGGAGSNTLDLSAYTSALTWTITGANTGTVGPVTGGFTGMQTLDGGAGGNTFNINHSTAMSLNGGAGNDDYVFANGVILTGSIDGKGGVNTLNFGAYLTAVDATLTGLGATVGFDGNTTGSPTDPITGTFSNITNIDGAAAGTLTGMGAAATWDLNLGTYTSGNVLTFSGFDTLKGGSVSDVFDVDASVAYNLDGGSGTESYVFGDTDVLTGSITGGAGSNTLDLSAYTSALTWTITGTNTGAVAPVSGGFSGVENLTGGTGADLFMITTGSITGTIDGGTGGTNTLNYSGATGPVTVTLSGTGAGSGTSVGNFSNISTLVGSASTTDTLADSATGAIFDITTVDGGSVSGVGFSSFEKLKGTGGGDTYSLDGGYVTTITGGATDTIVVDTATNAGALALSYSAGTIESAAAGDVLTASSLTLGGASSIKGITTATAFLTDVSSLVISSSSGSAVIDNAGALVLGGIAMGSGSFNLTVDTGNLTGGTIMAGNTTLTASNGSIGTSGANVLTNLSGTLTATATNGSIWVTDSGSLIVGNIAASSGTNGIHLAAASMTASGDTLNAGTGGTTLTTTGTMTLDNLTAVNGLSLANTGTLTVGSGGLHLTTLNAVLSQTGSGGSVLDGDIQTNKGNVLFRSGVTVNGSIGVTTGGGSASFSSTISGGGSSFNLNTGTGNILLTGVSLSMTSGTLALMSSGTVTFDSNVAASNVNLTGVTNKLAIGGTLTISTGDTNLDLTKIAGGIDDTAKGAHGLTIDTGTGSVSFGGTKVGSVLALRSLTIKAASMSLDSVGTTGGQSYTGNTQLNGNLTNIGGGSISLQGGAVSLGQNVTLDDTAGNISIASTVNGNRALTLESGGDVSLTRAVGGATLLGSLTITGKDITTEAVNTTGNQSYTGTLSLKGDLTSNNGTLGFKGKVQVLNSVTLVANQMSFSGGVGTVSGTKTLTILPKTTGYTVNLGGGGSSSTQLMLDSDAFDGYQGTLYIGGVPGTVSDAASSLAGLPTAGSVLVDGNMSLGANGTLVIVSKGDLTLQSGTISAGTVILGASNDLLSAPTGTTPATVEGNNIYTIATQIGQNGTGQAIDVGSLPSGAPAQLFIGSKNSSVFFVETPGTQENKDPNEQTLVDFADALGIAPLSGNVTVTNSGQQTAANQQTGGLLTSGFIDVSVFQQISLYDVSGSGIALPGDQCEEESSGSNGVCGAGGQ